MHRMRGRGQRKNGSKRGYCIHCSKRGVKQPQLVVALKVWVRSCMYCAWTERLDGAAMSPDVHNAMHDAAYAAAHR